MIEHMNAHEMSAKNMEQDPISTLDRFNRRLDTEVEIRCTIECIINLPSQLYIDPDGLLYDTRLEYANPYNHDCGEGYTISREPLAENEREHYCL